jgi:thiamine biosynthesis protein ThiS
MRLVINGLESEVAESVTLRRIIEAEGDPVEAVMIEVNGTLVLPQAYDSHPLGEGDRVEIILPAFGG